MVVNQKDSFLTTRLISKLHCSFSGALESDYPVDDDILNAESYPQHPEPDVTASTSSTSEDSGIGGISFVQCATGEHVTVRSESSSNLNTPTISRGNYIKKS